jgi:SAM-dependent methyltransferase
MADRAADHRTEPPREKRVKALQRAIAHLFFGSRRWGDRMVARFASDLRNQTILELGSGRQDLGEDAYSVRRFFHPSNEFIQSDVVPEYGHRLIDVTEMDLEAEFDVILCLNVLEHVFDYSKAVDNMHRALKEDGRLVIFVPMLYPLHDEPFDYWRFTEHSLRRLLSSFESCELKHRGLRQLPLAYLAVATR